MNLRKIRGAVGGPQQLYGREKERATLLEVFNRIVSSGIPELVLVSGYAGIGKSSLVNELRKMLVPARALFASGKFDQYKHDITGFAEPHSPTAGGKRS